MATFPINLLDGADGYLRWKESVLLLLHSVDVAYVLFDEPPSRAGGDGSQAAKWARDDGLCRGHILAVLSDRLLPVYVRHATGRALWQAVARTYEPDATSWELSFEELEFREDETLRERVARAESLAVATCRLPEPRDELVAYMVCSKLPDVAEDAIMQMKGDETSMDGLWRSAQAMERIRNDTQARVARREKEIRISGKWGHIVKKKRW
ncbi:hypothetical protein SETIT_6G149600v2 [Setaria italica]|uniref:Retrotransposon Copia-like N-terminal domain-containing protein n=1 Tax=Setaria italica TaxID=4555 RepID=A0A368RLX9_SETIT|nr:uncharacterized protein LOC101775728 [Setaria italica]XP_004973453.1 uncharacterized protein LOC101775728 [Setaria italica]XP_022683191.1 uncharacterized protein LOC101775728 [Setaria italica]RCV31097.1 hypothetical protein SETIT_6G149600v2 [Setaria italica]RCV31098.1 hypothetical protein SETIT_6G149600v2 [Setaria italica]